MKNRRAGILAIMMILLMALTAAACGRQQDPPEGKDEPPAENTEPAEPANPAEPAGPTGAPADGGYDILAGYDLQVDGSAVYLYGNDFLLIMPNNDNWSFEKIDDSAIQIYQVSARESGFGGKLVTIRAYDLDDDSYTQIPHYQEGGIGQNAGKRFVAIYPTDVQFDNDDREQADSYRELYDYLCKIGPGTVDSPLQTADSD